MFTDIARLRLLSACVPLALALAAFSPSGAAAAGSARPTVYKLTIPSPGHVSVAAVEVRVVKHGRGRAPSRLDLSLPKRFSLPSSVRFFYARRRVSPATYELLLISLNRTTGRPAVHASAHRKKHRRTVRASRAPQFDSRRITLHFPSRASFGHRCGSCGKKLPRKTSCKHCWFQKTVTRQAQTVNADTADAVDLASLSALLRAGWTVNGDTNPVFGDPAAGQPGDRTLDGGHLDDGHAFGWNRDSLSDLAPLAHTVVDDLLTGRQENLIPDLELIGNADLNGNGRLDAQSTPGGGASP